MLWRLAVLLQDETALVSCPVAVHVNVDVSGTGRWGPFGCTLSFSQAHQACLLVCKEQQLRTALRG
jgi:hypothetical protein